MALFKTFTMAPQCVIQNGYMSCKCDNTTDLDAYFPRLQIVVGSYSNQMELTLYGTGYMYYDVQTKKCISLVREMTSLNSFNYWILGMPFYRNFDILHDLQD